MISQLTEFTPAASVLVGLGCGLLAGVAFVWRSVIPRRAQARERGLDRDAAFKNDVRGHLRDLFTEGMRIRGAAIVPAAQARQLDWQRRVDSSPHRRLRQGEGRRGDGGQLGEPEGAADLEAIARA